MTCEFCEDVNTIDLNLGHTRFELCRHCWQVEMGDFSPVVRNTIRCSRNCRRYAEVVCLVDDKDLCYKHMEDHQCRDFDQGFVQVINAHFLPGEILIEYNYFSHRILISEGEKLPDRDMQDQMVPYLKYRVLRSLEEVLKLNDDRYGILLCKQLKKSLLVQDQMLGTHSLTQIAKVATNLSQQMTRASD